MRKRHVLRGLAGVFLALLVVLGLLGQIANNWSSKVNELLGIDDSTIQRSDDPEDYIYQSDYESASELVEAEIGLATRISAEGSVALKGLPAIEGTRVTLLGMRSGSGMQFGGSMGELVDPSNIVTLEQALNETGFEVNPEMSAFFESQMGAYAPTKSSGGNVVSSYDGQGAAIGELPVANYDASLVGDYTDAAIVVIGRDAGESACFYPGKNGLANPSEFSNSPTGNILSLSNDERDMIEWAKAQGFGKVIVLVNSAMPMELDELEADDDVDAILWIGTPGAYGTYGIAQLLKGDVLPSGHVPDTLAVNSALSPAAQNYGIYTFSNAAQIDPSNNHALRSDWYVAETEGIYTGYRYYETRYVDSVLGQGNASSAAHGESTTGSTWNYDDEVTYPFGYGVEGSTFEEEIVSLDIDWTGGTDSTATVRVTNTGDVPAKHVVQLYVSVPYTQNDQMAGIEKSAIQLVGYAKTGEARESTFEDVELLAPGESEELTITFNAEDIYSYATLMPHDDTAGAWILDAGDYCFATGNGSHDAVQAVLKELHPHIRADLDPTGDAEVVTLESDIVKTESNGVLVQNQLGNADLNSLGADTTVTYLSRKDWAGTFPVSIASITATDEMMYQLRNATYNAAEELEAYDGPTEFTYGADNGVVMVDLAGLDYDDPLYEQALDQMTLDEMVNHYLANIGEIQSLAFPRESNVDSPLGVISTLGKRTSGTIFEVAEDDPAYGRHTDVYAGAPVIAATMSPLLQSEQGRVIANDFLWTGYSTWFGPGLNLHRTPYNGRNIAYYSEDAVLSGYTAVYVHRSLDEYGIVTTAKHFAFNDQETNRDGIALFINEQGAREGELRGFQIPIRDGSLKGLMTAFNRLGCTHVAAHRGVMSGILFGEWGFKGHVITDSVKSTGYFLPRECIMAGNGMMLGGSNNGTAWNFTAQTVASDPVVQNALRESMHRKMYFYANSVLLNGMTAESAASGGLVWWALMSRILMGISFVGFAAFAALYVRRTLSDKE